MSAQNGAQNSAQHSVQNSVQDAVRELPEAEPPSSNVFGACPVPKSRYDAIVLGHGSGGRLTNELVQSVFLPAFRNDVLEAMEDQATLAMPGGGRVAMTTDGFVVKPLFFPGGDIGRLAICGTVNDLAVGGARPMFLSAAFILEEGLPIATLERVVASMRQACVEAGVLLVTGDTKVVDKGKGDEIFITTTGIGFVPAGRFLSVSNARPGDRVLVSGTLGDHGMAVMSAREDLGFETTLESDAAPLGRLAEALLAAAPGARCMRDPTRGGLAGALHDVAQASRVSVDLDERSLPLRDEVSAACELLGLDPLYVASEGRFVAIVPAEQADAALAAMRADPLGRGARDIGAITDDGTRMVTLRTRVGGRRIVTPLAGEQLPRIC